MSEWAKRKAIEANSRAASRREDRAWTLHKHEVLSSRAPAIWKRLSDAIQTEIETFNESCSDADRRFNPPSVLANQLIIRRLTLPDVRITVSLDINMRRITWERAVTKSEDLDPSCKEGFFVFDVNDNGEAHLTDSHGNPLALDQIAQHILEPVFGL